MKVISFTLEDGKQYFSNVDGPRLSIGNRPGSCIGCRTIRRG